MSQSQNTKTADKDGRRVFRYLSVAFVLGIVAWTVFKTEMRVAELRGRGFTDVAIDSARNHAYAPLIGGLLGAALMILIVLGLKRALGRKG